MKKSIKVIIGLMIVMGLLVACGGSDTPKNSASAQVGVASIQNSKMSDDSETVTFETIVAGVAMVDDKLVYVNVDMSEQKAVAEAEKIVAAVEMTKKDKGLDYGMKGASEATGLGKEWFEQIEAIQEALIGMNKAEVVAYFAGEEILSSATIYVGDLEMTILKAIDNAVTVENVAKVGLGHNVAINLSNEDTKVASVLEYAMMAVDTDGNITTVLLDTAEETATLQASAWTLASVGATKGELKEAYGMVVASPIGKEWFEQNNALMEYLSGKTAADVAGLNDYPVDGDDLKTSVTFGISGIKVAIANAEKNLTPIN